MNYPLWDIPAAGLLVAFVSIVHVFISHFAVGGGLFLVVAERRARRTGNAALLAYVERHSKFFALLTLVGGALTGVGIWFTIALVHPAATSSLIATFVWGWAIEWTFFGVEIAAAMVYYYGWHRLDARTHQTVGWIYFVAAWASLAIINGILSYMLTPGAWLQTRSFWDGVLNPTYLPSLVARTAAAVAIAGIYALFTATWLTDRQTRAQIARYAAARWVLPAAIVLPFAIAWYLAAASGANVPVAEAFGAAHASMASIVRALFAGTMSGYPIAQRALMAALGASALLALLTLVLLGGRASSYGRAYATLIMLCGFVALGGSEWVREDLRKPYVIGGYMFVNGLRLPPSSPALTPPPGWGSADRFTIDAVTERGVLASSLWARPVPAAGDETQVAIARGAEIFRLSCSTCHTHDGYLAIRPLVRGQSVAALNTMIGRLALPVDKHNRAAAWSAPSVRLVSWRGRHMPPFAGTVDEREDLADYLATVGGATATTIAAAHDIEAVGPRVFDEKCSICHGPDTDTPFQAKGRSADAFYQMIGRLPQITDQMPAFDGTDHERHELAEFLTTLDRGRSRGGER